MPKFSPTSAARLATCDERLQRVLNEAIKHWDFTVLIGHRDQAAQDAAFRDGKSTKRWPNSMHNTLPSKAVDIAPYPIDWGNLSRFQSLLNRIIGLGAAMGVKLRCGLDWDGDLDMKDQTFIDGPHLEIAE
jgi:hypothetical protein